MKILIIDDADAIRESMQCILEIDGHEVLAADNGNDGVELAKAKPDFIFCDVWMPPGLSGFDVLEAVRQQPDGKLVPFVFLTGNPDRVYQRRGMALGADDYITKPFTAGDIRDAIAARTRRHQPLRERIEELVQERDVTVGANWSHELMTPLIGVMGGLELIEEEADTIQPDELRELLALIRAGAERQSILSRKLILFYELERLKGSPRTKSYSCDAAAAIHNGVSNIPEEDKRPHDLTVQVDRGAVPAVEAQLIAIITEVVDNALRFSTSGQPVTVTGTCVDSQYQIEIVDQGLGMTPEECANIGPFIQFGRTRREQQGLGLGLATARAVVELAGGHLTLGPGPGGLGLQVTLDMPCA
jgi:two-component system sensor histidine kinase/response regulator